VIRRMSWEEEDINKYILGSENKTKETQNNDIIT
jgi:hypothetical protein